MSEPSRPWVARVLNERRRDEAAGPTAQRARFELPLSDPRLHFVTWSPEARAFVAFEPPALGESTVVPGQSIVDVMLGR